MDSYLTHADPVPVLPSSTESFNIVGIWHQDGTALDHVNFNCELGGVPVYDEDIKCDAEGTQGCTLPKGTAEEDWSSVFSFDVPAIAPDMVYHVKVTGIKADGTDLW